MRETQKWEKKDTGRRGRGIGQSVYRTDRRWVREVNSSSRKKKESVNQWMDEWIAS